MGLGRIWNGTRAENLAKKCAKPAMIKKIENIMGSLVCLQNATSCHRKQKKSQPRPQPQNWIPGCGCSHHFVNSLVSFCLLYYPAQLGLEQKKSCYTIVSLHQQHRVSLAESSLASQISSK